MGLLPRSSRAFAAPPRASWRSGEALSCETSVFALALEPRYMFDAAGLATGAEAAEQTAGQTAGQTAEQGQSGDGDDGSAGERDADADDPALDAALAAYTPPADEAGADGTDGGGAESRTASESTSGEALLSEGEGEGEGGSGPTAVPMEVPNGETAGEALLAAAPADARTEIVFVDTSVGDYETLVAGIGEAAEVVEIGTASPALGQIADALAGRSGVDAIHIVSHGQVGALAFGAGTVDAGNLADYAAQLQAIGAALGEAGDILLYGCYVGADGQGAAFLDALAEATGADVAASDDLTGAAELGGDWVLEAETGAIETVAIAAQSFSGTLNVVGASYDYFSGFRTGTVQDPGGPEIEFGGAGTGVQIDITSNQLILNFNTNGSLNVSSDLVFFGTGFQSIDSVSVNSSSISPTPSFTLADRDSVAGDASFTAGTDGINDTIVIGAFSYTNGDQIIVDFTSSSANAAPALGGTPPDATVTEDVATAIDLSAYNVSDADGDTLTLTLAVDRGTIASVDGDGVTAGVTVANSGTAAMTLQGTAASLNTYLNDSSKIRYTTALNDTTAATLTVTPNDGTVDGTPDTVTINVTPVNDAPVLNAGASPALTGIVEDAGDDDGSGADGDDDATNNANNPGTSVAAMVVDGSITDPDGGAVEAIAVTAVDNTNGVWQYSTDNGANWTAFSGTSGSSVDLSSAARLLDGTLADAATNLIRFVPDADYNGTATITFRAWDRSSGSAGGTADTTTNGGATAFSAASDTASISVSAVNDAPTISGLPASVSFTEDTQGNFDISAATFADVDSGSGNVTLTLAAGAGTFAATSGGGVTIGGSGSGTLTLTGTAANIDSYLNAAGNIQYTPASNASGSPATTVTVTANDGGNTGSGGGGNVSLGTINVNVSAVNDDPTISSLPASVTVTEDQASNFDLSAATFADVDSGGAAISLVLTAGAGTFTASDSGGVTVSGSGSGALTLSGTAANIDTFLNTASNIQYTTASNANGTPATTVTLTANDGGNTGTGGGTNVTLGTVNVNVTAVNDAPVFAGLDGAPSFTEDGSAVQLDADVTVSDVELGALNGGNGDFAGASLTIARNGGANADDRLSVASGGSLTVAGGPDGGGTITAGGNVIATIANTGNGQIQISFADNGTIPTTALVNEVLQAIRYLNAGDDPPASVQLDWSFSDGNSGDAQGTGANPGTGTGSTTVSITGVNDEPTLTATGQDPTYVEGGGAPGADLYSTVNASTVESGQTFTSLTLTVTNVSDGANEILRVDGSDVALTDGNSVTTATNGLTVNVSVAGSTATVSFTGASLSAAALQTLVDALAYRNASDNPTTAGNRVVTITQVTDSGASGGANDNTAALTLASTVSLTAVNNPPVVGSVFGETSQVTAGSGAQNVSGFDDATVSNPDSADYDGGVLTLVQGSGTTNGSWGLDGTTATAGGDGSIAAGETIAVGGTSIGTVDATNDGQGGNTLEIALNADATSARIQSLIRALTYSAPSGLGDRGFTLTLNDADGTSDGGDQDASGSFTVSVTPNPPVVANLDGDSVSTPNGTAVSIDQGGNATVSDPDSANFNGGNLTITRTSGSGDFSLNAAAATSGGDGTIAAGQTVAVGGTDIGTVTTDGQGTNDLVITFNSADATPARVQALIRALQFSSTDGGSNTFSLTVTDAGSSAATSTAAGFTVDVEAAPVNSVPGAQTATDGTALALGGISVADADSANVTTTVSVGAGQGTFTTSGAATIAGGGTNSIQISGTLAAVNATLANLAYTPAVDSSGNQTITVLTSDGTNSDTDTIAVTVSDRPNLGNLAGDSQTVTPGSTANLDAGANATVTDTDSADFDGGNLTLSRVSGSLSGNFSLDGTTATADGDGTIAAGETIAVGGTSIGTVTSDGQGTNNLVIALNADATPARVATLLQNLRYTSSAAGTHGFDVTLTDAAGGTTSEAARAELVFNSAPAITTNTGLSHTAGTATVLTTAMLAASDAEGDAVTYPLTSAPGTGSLRLDGSALAAGQSFTAAQLAAGQVSFLAPADTPAGSTSFQVTPGDGTSSGAAASVAVAIAAAPAAETGTAETGTGDTGTGGTGTGGTGDTGEADDDGDAVTVVVERRGPVQLVLVQTPAGNLQFATAPTQVSGAAVQAIFSTFEQGNSPLARAFYSSLLGGSATPVAQAFASAVSDPAVRGLLSAAANEGRALYYFDGSDWQLLDLSTLDDAGAIQQAGGAPGTNPDASQSAAATAATATAATATAATATAATAGLPDGIQLAAQLGDQLGDQLGNTQLGAQPGDTQPGAQPGDPQPGDPQPGDPLAPRAAAPAGAESFQRQLAAAALGFEREAARLAAALLATKT